MNKSDDAKSNGGVHAGVFAGMEGEDFVQNILGNNQGPALIYWIWKFCR